MAVAVLELLPEARRLARFQPPLPPSPPTPIARPLLSSARHAAQFIAPPPLPTVAPTRLPTVHSVTLESPVNRIEAHAARLQAWHDARGGCAWGVRDVGVPADPRLTQRGSAREGAARSGPTVARARSSKM